MCGARPVATPTLRLHGWRVMETEASLMHQCPLLLPQNRAKTVYEGFITAQVLARCCSLARRASLAPRSSRRWKSVTGAVRSPDLWGLSGAAPTKSLEVWKLLLLLETRFSPLPLRLGSGDPRAHRERGAGRRATPLPLPKCLPFPKWGFVPLWNCSSPSPLASPLQFFFLFFSFCQSLLPQLPTPKTAGGRSRNPC